MLSKSKKKTGAITKDRKSLEFRDKAVKKFWRKNITKGDETIVTKDLFYAQCLKHVTSNRLHLFGKIGEEEERKKFVRLCVDKFFIIPHPEKYPEKKAEIHKYVDKESIQFCINVFGPWIQIFTFFYNNFYNCTQEVKPLDVFWGFIDDAKVKEMLVKGKESKSSKKMRYLLRYRIHPDTQVCDLVISSIRRQRKKKVTYHDEPLVRKKLRQIPRKEDDDRPPKENLPKFQYTEKVASVGKYENQTTSFSKLENLLEYLRGNYQEDTKNRVSPKIKSPIFTEEYKATTKRIPTHKEGESSTEPETPQEREPIKITPMQEEENETSENTLKRLEEEEKKLQAEYEENH